MPIILPTLGEIDAELARRSLSVFCKQAWQIVNPGRKLQWGWYLDAICLHLEAVYNREIPRLLITQPPNTLKSFVFSVCWPAWIWANRPSERFLWASNDGPLATRDAVAMRDLVESRWYKSSFRSRNELQWRLKTDQDEKTWFLNTKGGHRVSYSVSARVTGKKGDILGIDDANDAKKVHSASERSSVNMWFDDAFSGRVADERSSPIVIVGQRTHRDDLIGHVKKKQAGWVELRLPEQFDPTDRCVTPIWSDPRTVAGEWLRPNRFAENEKQERISNLGSRGYSSQHLQKPLDADGSMFKDGWIKYAKSSPITASRVRYWDKAYTADGGCFTRGVLMARDSQGLFWIEDVQGGQLSPLQRDQLMLSTAQSDQYRFKRVQVGFEQEPAAGVEAAQKTIRLLAGFEVKADAVRDPKDIRAQALAAQMEAGNVTIVEGPWNASFVDELKTFPDGKYKDQVDAASGAFNQLAKISSASPSVTVPKKTKSTAGNW